MHAPTHRFDTFSELCAPLNQMQQRKWLASDKNHGQMTDGVTARDRDIRRGEKKEEEMRRVKMGVGTGRKKIITLVTIEIDSLPQSELSSFSLSNLLTLFLRFLLLLLLLSWSAVSRTINLREHCQGATEMKPILLHYYQRLRSQTPLGIITVPKPMQ